MKTLVTAVLVMIMVPALNAQDIYEDWKEMETFHGIMASTYHPAENGNFEPIKSRSSEMVKKAKAVSDSQIPLQFQSEEMTNSVAALYDQSRALDKFIKKESPSDEMLMAKLEALHDTFHSIVGLCKDEDGH